MGMFVRWAVLAMVLGGCSSPEPRPLDPVKSETEFRARSLSEDELFRYLEKALHRAPTGAWDLEALTFAAFFYHPELDVARARLSGALAGIETADAIPNPTVNGDLEKVLNSAGPPSPWVYGLNLNMPLDFLWKRGYRVEQARQSALAARYELSEVGWHVRGRLRAAFVDHLLAVLELDGRRLEEGIRGELATLLERRLGVGETFRLEVVAAQADLATAKVATLAAVGRVAESRAALASSVGIPDSALEGVRFAWPDLEKLPAEAELPLGSVVAAGLVNRLDIRRVLSEYAAREAELQLELAKRYPDLNLGPGYLWDQGDKKFTLGFSVSLPIFNQNGGPIAEAEAHRKEVAARFLALQAGAIAEMEAALARYRSASAQKSAVETTIALVRKRETAIQRAIELGEMDRVALAGVRLEMASAREARLGAIRRAQAALGELEDAVQRPLGPDSPALDPGSESPRTKEKP
jgi:cobalt-zinc-cadmium efflux system outer membrane protein